jgi:hypothetical protein
MSRILAFHLLLALTLPCLAQGEATTTSAAARDRDALLKAAVARDRGEITALEPLSGDGGGVAVGYSSGSVLNCFGGQSCREFGGTPNTAVQTIAVSKRGGAEIIWVSYQYGALYQCLESRCTKFLWDGKPAD